MPAWVDDSFRLLVRQTKTSPAAAPVAFRPAQEAPQLLAAAASPKQAGNKQSTKGDALTRVSVSPGPLTPSLSATPVLRLAAGLGGEPRGVCPVSPGLQNKSAPRRWERRGPGPRPAGTRHCPAGNATAPRRTGPAAGTARRAAAKAQAAARLAEPSPRLEGQGVLPLPALGPHSTFRPTSPHPHTHTHSPSPS